MSDRAVQWRDIVLLVVGVFGLNVATLIALQQMWLQPQFLANHETTPRPAGEGECAWQADTTKEQEGTRGIRDSQLYFRGQVRRKVFMEPGLLLFDKDEMEFLIVSDLDKQSRHPERFLWHSYLKRGLLKRSSDGKYEIEWKDQMKLESTTARHNRSMELSELVRFNHRLLAMCDYTGLIFKIDDFWEPNSKPKVYQRWAIADGDGEKVKPCKLEWATVKDGILWVGSMGKEWIDSQGRVVHRDAEWVKTIDDAGRVENLDWGPVYQTLRSATNTSAPGYLWHEAVHWDPRMRNWIFLPRKASAEAYSPTEDESKGSNLVIIASEDFSSIDVRRIGELDPMKGFTAVRKIPGQSETYLALKVLETETETKTWITVFDLQGHMLLDPPLQFVGHVKFEGLEFV